MGEIENQGLANFAKRSATRSKDLSYRSANAANQNFDKNNQYGVYTAEQIAAILQRDQVKELRELSVYMYATNGIYKRVTSYFSNLLKFETLLVPKFKEGVQVSKKEKKNYVQALDILDAINMKLIGPQILLKIIVSGAYYGIFDKQKYCFQDLPENYCRCRFKTERGINVIEFDLSYFDSIRDEETRKALLEVFPKDIAAAYKTYKRVGRSVQWYIIPPEVGACFFLTEGRPLCTDLIPSILDYNDMKAISKKRFADDLYKLIVQHCPTNKDGNLMYTFEELEQFHEMLANILEDADGVDVVTTPLDVQMHSTKGSDGSNGSAPLTESLANVYNEAGVSQQLFSATGNSAMSYSVNTDLALVMQMVEPISNWLTVIINSYFPTQFTVKILPLSYFNEKEFMDAALKAGQFGYSLLLPGIAMGIKQSELTNLKKLETEVLQLSDILIPLKSSHTQSKEDIKVEKEKNKQDESNEEGQEKEEDPMKEPGRKEKSEEDKSDKTIENEESK